MLTTISLPYQKNGVMNKFLLTKKLNRKDHLRIAGSLLVFTNGTAILVFAFLRLLFIQTPITVTEDLSALGDTMLIGSVIGMALYAGLLIVEIADQILSNKMIRPYSFLKYTALGIFTGLILYLSGCKSHVSAGISTSASTGLTTSYKNLEPGSTVLVMNNEILNHTDIPLGENFMLINDDVKGLVEKDGKVSAGCKLVIRDKQGRYILNEEDLFKNEDVFAKEKAKALKCTIYTGKPMNWDENYDVAVTFWDKYGDGKIENNFSIRMIDIP